MDDIAMYFQKINLGDGRYIFNPIDIIRGKYNADENNFVTVTGLYYENIFGGSPDAEALFGYPTTISRLREKYDDNDSNFEIEVLLGEYVKELSQYLYVGYFDLDSVELSFIRILFDGIDNFIEEQEKKLGIKYKDTNSIENNISSLSEPKFVFDKIALTDLRNSESIESIRNKIDLILGTANGTEIESDIQKYPEIILKPKNNNKIITLKKLREEILTKIIGQDTAVNDITRSIMINQTSKNPKNKSHILVTGPTGTGKTEIVKVACETLNLPYFEADSTAYTKEGYVGKSVYSMLDGLLIAANGDIVKAQNGILVIDEIDKKIYGSGSDSEFSKDMLYCLLKIMDRGRIELKDGDYFDTSNLTIILMGAFEQIYESKLKENNSTMGFTISKPILEKRNIILTKEDIIKAGMPSEFIGRIGDITSTCAFTKDDLINILNKSKISALKLQKEYFKDAFGVKLTSTKDYVEAVAKKAISAKTNARELKPIIRESLKYATDEFLMGRKAKTLKITKETVLDPKKYYIK